MQKLLFLCSGNYYRSRFAEEYFNHLAESKGLKWKAYSKGLSQNMPSPNNPGPVSVHTIQALKNRNVSGKHLSRNPMPVVETDFLHYDKIIALSEIEHKPMLITRFNGHHAKVDYFEVGDLPLEEPEAAMTKLSILVEKLVRDIDR
jgi:protein-tyrosine phosphatase